MTSSRASNVAKAKQYSSFLSIAFLFTYFLRNARRSLLTHSEINRDLLQEALRGSAVAVESIGLSSYHFFVVLSQVVCAN